MAQTLQSLFAQQPTSINIKLPVLFTPTTGYPPTPAYGTDSYLESGMAAATQAAPYVPGAVSGVMGNEAFETASRRGRVRRTSSGRVRANSRGSARVGRATGGFASEIFGAVKTSVIVGSLISIAVNGYAYAKGRQNFAATGTNIAGDVVSSAVGGTAGALASAIGCGIFGLTGLPLAIVGFGLGIGGYMLADNLLRKTNFFRSMQNKTYSLLGG